MVAVLNVGLSVPELGTRLARLALADGALVIVIVYVRVVVPSWAVTTVTIGAFTPTFSAIGPKAVPEDTVVPLMVTVAVLSAVTGVSVTEVVAFDTEVV